MWEGKKNSKSFHFQKRENWCKHRLHTVGRMFSCQNLQKQLTFLGNDTNTTEDILGTVNPEPYTYLQEKLQTMGWIHCFCEATYSV